MKINKRYVPAHLDIKDKKKQLREILKSRKMYKQGIYHTRNKIPSFQTKKSHHIENAKILYGVNKIGATKELATKTGCSVKSLSRIIKKGEGAYYSSGSRPNQTAQSWGIARLASAITAGKSAAVDYSILENGCIASHSKALSLAKKAREKYGHGTRKAPKTNI